MSAKHTFHLTSQDKQRELPRKIIIGQQDTETIAHVVLKLFAYILFYRPRLQLELDLQRDTLAFVPDLVELDYELRPTLWIECGECSMNKLHKLAVKLPDTEFWIVKRSDSAARDLLRAMEKEEFRRERYNIVGLDLAMFNEICGMIKGRNEILWVNATFEPPNMQFDFNGLWFDAPFTLLRY